MIFTIEKLKHASAHLELFAISTYQKIAFQQLQGGFVQ